jgi:antitoxin (DNA-binding transcriptional repressor) of toxin-antitoxin stability system
MAVIHVTEAEAVRDFAKVLAHVRAGSEVVIDSEQAPVAVLVPPTQPGTGPNAEYDLWFRSQVQQALDDTRCDAPATRWKPASPGAEQPPGSK